MAVKKSAHTASNIVMKQLPNAKTERDNIPKVSAAESNLVGNFAAIGTVRFKRVAVCGITTAYMTAGTRAPRAKSSAWFSNQFFANLINSSSERRPSASKSFFSSVSRTVCLVGALMAPGQLFFRVKCK